MQPTVALHWISYNWAICILGVVPCQLQPKSARVLHLGLKYAIIDNMQKLSCFYNNFQITSNYNLNCISK